MQRAALQAQHRRSAERSLAEARQTRRARRQRARVVHPVGVLLFVAVEGAGRSLAARSRAGGPGSIASRLAQRLLDFLAAYSYLRARLIQFPGLRADSSASPLRDFLIRNVKINRPAALPHREYARQFVLSGESESAPDGHAKIGRDCLHAVADAPFGSRFCFHLILKDWRNLTITIIVTVYVSI
jgi:hypothetical protein